MEYGAEVWATGGWREGEEAMGRFWKRLIGMRRNTNKEVVQGELGRIRMKGRWDMARLRLWNKLVSGSNPLASWVYRQRREEFESKGRKDQRNWCWYTWKILQELGKEVDWKVEYRGCVAGRSQGGDLQEGGRGMEKQDVVQTQTPNLSVGKGTTKA